jgi:DASH complex subunit DAD2
MSFAPRTTTIRSSSGLGLGGSQNSQSSALQARIHEKKSELESLRQLRDLSAGLAGQMQQLEEKLATLSDGTEAVAAVMANWGSVLRAVSMASGKYRLAYVYWLSREANR